MSKHLVSNSGDTIYLISKQLLYVLVTVVVILAKRVFWMIMAPPQNNKYHSYYFLIGWTQIRKIDITKKAGYFLCNNKIKSLQKAKRK